MISIIIPTLNEERYLPKLLASIRNQKFSDYEIIVADSNSLDNTVKEAKKFRCRVYSLPKGKKTHPSMARNLGARHAKGEYLLFLDADVVLTKNFLKKAFDEFEDRYLDLASAGFSPTTDNKADVLLAEITNIILKSTQRFFPHGVGFCIMSTHRIFRRIGGFNEKLKLAEDHDFIARGTKVGGKYRILENPHFKVSFRRVDKEGRFTLIKKYLYSEAYRLAKGEITEDIFEYEFGNYDNKKRAEPFSKKITLLRKKMSELEQALKEKLN